MKKKLLLIIMLLCSFFVEQKINAQVNVGDIAFIGYQTGAPAQDGFTFITLRAIPAGTTIYFTDRGWNRTTSTWVTGSTEMHLQWNVPGIVPAGTIVSVIETTTADQLTVTGTTGLGLAAGFTGFNLSGGDQMLAYISAAGVQPVSPNAPTFIAGVHADYNSGDYDPVTTWNTDNTTGGNSSALPIGLTNGVNCISLYPGVTEMANAKYTGTLTGTSADLSASINNQANWSKSNTADLGILPSNFSVPNVSTAVLATVSSATASNIKSVSATLGGSVSADGGDPSVVRGIVWSTSANPVVTTNTTVPIGSGTGTFSTTITGLPAATTIHFRAYATNSAGTSYGNDLTFTTGAALTAPTPSKTDVSCNGGNTGSATVTPTGGTTPYTYSWSPAGGSGATTTNLPAGNYTVTVTDSELTQITRSVTINQPNALLGIVSKVSVSCNGGTNGSATVAPSGGTTPYTYLWSNGVTTATASSLVVGTYSVTITDANACTKTINNIVIDQPPLLTGTASTTSVSCFGGTNGTATVTASGGIAPYTYSWSPSGGTAATASGLAAGTYSVTITDANSCSTTVSNIVVGGPTNALIASAGAQTNILCNGSASGSATVNVTGGTGAYTYSWSPSGGTAATATGLTAGTYTVTVTDANSCQATQSFTISGPTALIATPVAQTNVACNGSATGSATVSATGGTGAYTYSWAPSGGTAATATGLTAGTYVVTVTDANLCQSTQAFTISQPAAALSATTTAIGVSCYGGSNGSASVTVSGGTPGYTYLWAPLGGTTSSVNGRPAGNYTCTITDANGCTLIKNLTINTPAALSPTITKTDVSCNGGANGTATVAVTGGTGAYTYSWSPTGGTAATASGLVAGTYTVTIADANICQVVQSVTINQPALLTATQSQTNVLCNGGATGTATVNVSGGSGSYTYLWSPSGGTAATATGLTVGNYSCLVTDANGCSVTKNFTIVQPSVLSATTSQINATCSTGGQAAVTVSGGTPSYTYLWSPSGATTAIVTGLTAGNHSVLITDANGCTLTKNFVITSTNTLVATTSKSDVLCNGAATGFAYVVPSGAPGPYTYVWSPSGGNTDTATNLTAGNYSVTITSSNGCSIVKNFTITQPSALVVTPNPQTNVSCNSGANGSASVTVTGGTGGYTYSWAPSGGTAATASGLSAGTYTVTVKDANLCTKTQSFTITEPTALVATTTQVNVSCNSGSNGSATVNVTGGTGAYSYLWSPSGGTAATATGLLAGTYTVTVKDANLCQTTASVTITQPTALAATTSKTNVICNGSNDGTATVNVTGGTGAYTYSWSPSGGTAASASGLAPGIYVVTVKDANLCQTTASVTITEPTLLTSTVTSTNVSCNSANNGSATVTTTGGTGTYTYLWSPSGGTAATATGLAPGNYSVKVRDANLCETLTTVTITEPAALVATATQVNVSCNGGSNGSATVNVTGGTAPYTYAWSPSGGTAATASGLTAGVYAVTITDANACQTTINVTITEPVLLSATTSKIDVSCNGANDGTATVNATGGTGAYTYSWSPSGGTAASASGLAPGIYVVTVKDANLCQTTASVTITEPTLLTSTVTSTNVSCNSANNGSATVTTTGGTGAYTYLWFPSGGTAATATGLVPGNYSVKVRDANLCETLTTVTITEPAALVATATQVNVSCNGGSNGSATVNVTGGTAPYTYAWSPSGGTAATASGLTAGVYAVTITDANACQTIINVTITEPVLLSATTSKIDVSCNGANDGTATVNATGGTGAYTYSWAPSGGTAATATGLSPNTYTVTITDANGCFITKTINIIPTPDVTAPVPNVASLPVITNYCSVLASEIAIPTATDNCSGVINGTTTDPLTYNAVGTYVITWKYADASGNTTTQTQTIKVLDSPISVVALNNAEFTYDGNPHSLQVVNLPAGATVVYSANNISTNAGTYAVTATITPLASSPNCSTIVLTANLVIKKASQQITFSAIPVKTLGANNNFNLVATSSAGLPITFTSTYSSALPPATISATGAVTMLRSGQILITAQQVGNSNYLAATDVSQLLVILNNNIDVKSITIGSKVFENPGKTINYLLPCGDNNPTVSIVNESNATITPSVNFTLQTPKPGIYTQNATITSEDGSTSATYSITVEKPFGFYDIVHQKFNNVLLVNNNPQTNGGYEFVSYQWFKNGQLVGTGQYYSAGNDTSSTLDANADYMVKMTTKDGKVLQTCSTKIKFTNSLQAKLYPNPVEVGKVLTVEADFPKEELDKMQISLYSVTGKLIKTVQSSAVVTEIQLPETTESNMYLVVLETPNAKKSFKVIVK